MAEYKTPYIIIYRVIKFPTKQPKEAKKIIAQMGTAACHNFSHGVKFLAGEMKSNHGSNFEHVSSRIPLTTLSF